MSNIQAGINQLISTISSGVGMWRSSASGQAAAATKEADKAQTTAEGYKKTLSNPTAFTGTPQEQEIKRKGIQQLYTASRDSAVSHRLRAVNLQPSQQRVDAYLDSYTNQQQEQQAEQAQNPVAKSTQASKTALTRMAGLGMQQIEQRTARRNFMEYLKGQQTSLGNFGDLPDSIQKQIAKSYSAAERKKLMDEADAEKGRTVKNGGKV